jgi:hypothetical protein
MKYMCDDCKEYHDTSDLTINIGDEGYKVIDDINEAVMGIVEKRTVPYDLLMYSLAAVLDLKIYSLAPEFNSSLILDYVICCEGGEGSRCVTLFHYFLF